MQNHLPSLFQYIPLRRSGRVVQPDITSLNQFEPKTYSFVNRSIILGQVIVLKEYPQPAPERSEWGWTRLLISTADCHVAWPLARTFLLSPRDPLPSNILCFAQPWAGQCCLPREFLLGSIPLLFRCRVNPLWLTIFCQPNCASPAPERNKLRLIRQLG